MNQPLPDPTPEPPPALRALPATEADPSPGPGRGGAAAYLRIARVDHWFKNVFMLLGVLLAMFYRPDLAHFAQLPDLLLALFATCLIASSNYVLNEYLDAARDRQHPTKRFRPAACGQVRGPLVIAEWALLGLAGLGLAFAINAPLGLAAALLWLMGCAYNVPPVRLKDLPYVDVVSESLNNPIRLTLGWFAVLPGRMPPLSLLLAYWMAGAFFMAIKRFAEYRQIGDPEQAGRYRHSFWHYDEDRLLISMLFYVTAGALFGGIFIVRYKLELILWVPVVAGFFAYYMKLGLRPDSPVQAPERLHRERRFFSYALVTAGLLVLLMLVEIPSLYTWFNVEPSSMEPLWSFDGHR